MPSSVEQYPLPDYERPPLVETVLGVQFERIERFGNGHLGAFWRTLDTGEWPTVSDAPLLPPQFERFGNNSRWAASLQFSLSPAPVSRLQIRHQDGERMIQVQNGRLHFNWLGRAGGVYPRYETVRQGFHAALEQFVKFLDREKLGDFRPNQWEVTYLNHIVKGTVWNTPSDWRFFRPLCGLPSIEGLVYGESFSGEWHFVIPERRGRLHIQWEHAVRSEPQETEVIVLTLTARGPLGRESDLSDGILSSLDLGRETIVRAFRDFMSDEANRYWGLRNDPG